MASTAKKVSHGSGKRSAALRVLDRIGTTEVVVVVIATGICLWGWMTFVVTAEPDFATFTIVYGIALATSGTIQSVMLLYVRSTGSLRARLGWNATFKDESTAGVWLLLFAPIVFTIVFMLIVTPPTTSVDSFDPDMVLYQVIALFAALGLIFTLIGAGLVIVLVVMPIALLIAACLPIDRDSDGRPLKGMMTTSELVIAGSILLSAVGFALSISSVIPRDGSLSKLGRMREQLAAFVAFSGDPVATVLGWFFITALVVLVVADRRTHRKKEEPR